MSSFIVTGNLVDIHRNEIYPAEITVKDGRIASIIQLPTSNIQHYILPGFIDSHVHIESSMLVPSEFARLAAVHGTVATISDPHEIANVCGIEGVNYMIENGKTVPFKFNFGAPSCVPATIFETAGAALNAEDVEALLKRSDVLYLSEMMNFPGVLYKDKEVMKKIAAAHRLDKPVDGHAPGLRGETAKQYIDAGISTDHECFTAEEALDKLKYGMKILIREGSAAKNFEALIDLLHEYPDQIMFCSDDKHPDSLVLGHINQLCARAVAKGIDIFKVLKAACLNPVLHYKPNVGLLRVDDPADFIIVKDLEKFEVVKTYIDGELVAENGKSLMANGKWQVANGGERWAVGGQQWAVGSGQFAVGSGQLAVGSGQWAVGGQQLAEDSQQFAVGGQQWAVGSGQLVVINNFSCNRKIISDFETPFPIDQLPAGGQFHHPIDIGSPLTIPVIEALDGQLITNKLSLTAKVENGNIVSDIDNDILKIVVVNRYQDAPIAKAFIKNFGLKDGALASSVAHDSHNIVAVGVDDESLCKAVNLLIDCKGGVSCVKENMEMVLPLPVAGLMSTEDGYKVAEQYSLIDRAAKDAGSTLSSPYMTLSFMALLVIPHLKLSDKGLFDGDNFEFIK